MNGGGASDEFFDLTRSACEPQGGPSAVRSQARALGLYGRRREGLSLR